MRSLRQRNNRRARSRHQLYPRRPPRSGKSSNADYADEGLERVKSIRVPARVSNQIINADEASDHPRLPAIGSTKPPINANNTLAFVTRNARRRMRVTFCSQLIRRSSAEKKKSYFYFKFCHTIVFRHDT